MCARLECQHGSSYAIFTGLTSRKRQDLLVDNYITDEMLVRETELTTDVAEAGNSDDDDLLNNPGALSMRKWRIGIPLDLSE